MFPSNKRLGVASLQCKDGPTWKMTVRFQDANAIPALRPLFCAIGPWMLRDHFGRYAN